MFTQAVNIFFRKTLRRPYQDPMTDWGEIKVSLNYPFSEAMDHNYVGAANPLYTDILLVYDNKTHYNDPLNRTNPQLKVDE